LDGHLPASCGGHGLRRTDILAYSSLLGCRCGSYYDGVHELSV
jgi:hypothetical protein